jgi:hypothetical protein
MSKNRDNLYTSKSWETKNGNAMKDILEVRHSLEEKGYIGTFTNYIKYSEEQVEKIMNSEPIVNKENVKSLFKSTFKEISGKFWWIKYQVLKLKTMIRRLK